MAKRPYNVKQLLNMDHDSFMRMNRKEMAAALGVMRDAANKRYKALSKSGIKSAAARQLEKSGGKITVPRSASLNELRSEYHRARSFLESKVSTIKGAKEFRQNVINALGDKGINLSNTDFDKFFTLLEELKETDPIAAAASLKYVAMEELNDEIVRQGGEISDLEGTMERLSSKLRERYEEMQEIRSGASGVSAFFDI